MLNKMKKRKGMKKVCLPGRGRGQSKVCPRVCPTDVKQEEEEEGNEEGVLTWQRARAE